MIQSNHKMSDIVKIPFIPNKCWVEGIKFTEDGKILYDIGVQLSDGSTVVKDVDSIYVQKDVPRLSSDSTVGVSFSAGSTGTYSPIVGVDF